MSNESLQWVALFVAPQMEFRVQNAITQAERPAMVPFEEKWKLKQAGSKMRVKRRYALFPRYVFAGLRGVGEDYSYFRGKVPELQGIVSRSPSTWSPYVLSARDVDSIGKIMSNSIGMTEIDLHKALRPGKRVYVEIGGHTQETVIDEVTKKGVKALLKILGGMPISVEVPFDKVRAA